MILLNKCDFAMERTENKLANSDNVFYYLSLCISASLPFSIKVNSVAVIALTAYWIVYCVKNRGLKLRKTSMVILPLLLFLVYMYGAFISKSASAGFKEIEQRLTFLIFPLIYSSIPVLKVEKLRNVLVAFVLSCLVLSLLTFRDGYDFIFAEHRVWAMGEKILLHRPYFGLYCGVAILILMWLGSICSSVICKIGVVAGVIWFLAFVILINAKMAALSLFASLYLLLCIYLMVNKKKFAAITVNGLMLLLFSLMYLQSNTVREVVNTIISFKSFSYDRFDSMMVDSFNVRLGIWNCSFQTLFSGSTWLTGLGTADVKDALTLCYNSMSFQEQAANQFNAHNQLLEIWIGAGLFGVIVYFLTVFGAGLHAIRSNKYLFMGFLILFLLCSFTESLLNAQKGIVLFSLFYSLFSFQMRGNEEKVSNLA